MKNTQIMSRSKRKLNQTFYERFYYVILSCAPLKDYLISRDVI